jgi:NADPH:quinone reductase-like Zn-dependent oxidoreductase
MTSIEGTAARREALQSRMRAAVVARYGPPESVHLTAVPVPRPGDHGVLIRVAATTVSAADWRVRAHAMPRGFSLLSRLALGWTGPRQPILGTELSGTVVEVGKAVTRFRPGDAVIAFTGARMGTHAEYCAVADTAAIVAKPAGLSWTEAAALSFGGTTALFFLRDKGKVRSGESVLVIGASGAVGSAAVQLARHFGAGVTAVTSGANLDLVRKLGAEHVIDYTAEDFTRSGRRYDIILDCVGATTFAHARAALEPDGRFLMVATGLPEMLGALTTLPFRQKAIAGMAPERADDLALLAELAQRGAWRPLVDEVLPFDAIVAAHRRVESGRKRGSVVLVLAPETAS